MRCKARLTLAKGTGMSTLTATRTRAGATPRDLAVTVLLMDAVAGGGGFLAASALVAWRNRA